MKALKTIGVVLSMYVALALVFDGFVGRFQPQLSGAEGVLRTYVGDEVFETRLAVIDDGDTVWVQSGHHFRGWYDRILRNPEVLLFRDDEAFAYTAVPVETPEAKAHVRELLIDRGGAVRFWIIRAILLFAEIKPVRLDPR